MNNTRELTLKSILIAIVITLLLTAANAYLGLKVGITVSASIPAAIMAIGVLSLFKNHNVYEMNMVQTAASTGETLAAGMIFTLPAMLLIQFWDMFHYWQSFFIAIIGGFLGILFSVPLRRVLLNDPVLHFPEGTAIGNILKIAQDKTHSLKHLLIGGIGGAVIAFFQSGLKILSEGWQYWTKAGTTIAGFGLGFSPALIGAGFIVGPRVAFSILSGIIIGWFVLLPLFGQGASFDVPTDMLVIDIWKNKIRFVGLGVILVAGLWTLFSMIKPIWDGIKTSLRSITVIRTEGMESLPKHEQDIPIHWVILGIVLLMLPLMFLILSGAKFEKLLLTGMQSWTLIVMTTTYVLIAGFIFASICGYLVGLVGSSASPVSAMGLAGILIFCLLLLLTVSLFGKQVEAHTLALSALAIVVVALITCMSAIANDTMQDLKAGQMIGATPWKQQLIMFVGVITAALILPKVMDLLYLAYGIGDQLPRPDMNPAESLAAPQAQLMAAISAGVFNHNVPWTYIELGVFIAVLTIIVNQYLKQFDMSLPTLGIGMGIYLPIESATSLVLGGMIAWFVQLHLHRKDSITRQLGDRQGILMASGMVAGAALIGIFLAIPFVIFESTDALRIMPAEFTTLAHVLGLLVTAAFGYYLYWVAIGRK